MPQTLLALLALAISSLLVFSQQRLTLRSQTRMVSNEIELAASGLGSEIIEMIGARSFDETTTPGAIHSSGVVPDDASGFTSPAQAGATDRGAAGCDLLQPKLTPDCDDVDDVDGLDWVPVQMDLSHGRSLPFEVRVRVDYVTSAESEVPVASPTRHKRVTIDVRSPHVLVSDLFTMSRVISYDRIKAEYDYERDYGAVGTAPAETGADSTGTAGG